MTKYKIDFTDADGFPLVEQGLYPAVITGASLKESDAGNQYFEFLFEVISGPEKGTKLPPLRNMVNMKDKNFYLKATLNVLGYECEGIADIETEDLIGLTAQVQINHREYEGRLVADISSLYSIETIEPASLDTNNMSGSTSGAFTPKEDIPW